MGHLILIAEDTIRFLTQCPGDLLTTLTASFDQEEWLAFVEGPYSDTKKKDNMVMGGGKPVAAQSTDDTGTGEDTESDEDEEITDSMNDGQVNGRQLNFSQGFGFDSSNAEEDGESGETAQQVCFSPTCSCSRFVLSLMLHCFFVSSPVTLLSR